LGARRDGCELHRREGGRGEQHEAEFGHGGLDPGNELWILGLLIQGVAINEQALGWIVAGVERGTGFILQGELAKTTPFMAHSEDISKRQFRLSPARSVAGLGVAGLLGPYPGISSGIFPGSSCGCGGAPGS
jgi:hypothetical protein